MNCPQKFSWPERTYSQATCHQQLILIGDENLVDVVESTTSRCWKHQSTRTGTEWSVTEFPNNNTAIRKSTGLSHSLQLNATRGWKPDNAKQLWPGTFPWPRSCERVQPYCYWNFVTFQIYKWGASVGLSCCFPDVQCWIDHSWCKWSRPTEFGLIMLPFWGRFDVDGGYAKLPEKMLVR